MWPKPKTTRLSSTTHAWLTSTAISGYTGTTYLHALPDMDTCYPTNAITDSAAITDSPKVEYLVNFTAPATYTVWVRGYADNADADALNVGVSSEVTGVTAFAPEAWTWANESASQHISEPAQVEVESSGLYTLTVGMAEDGSGWSGCW